MLLGYDMMSMLVAELVQKAVRLDNLRMTAGNGFRESKNWTILRCFLHLFE
jgi:hypothetical protein